MTVGDRIKEARKALKMERGELSRLSGVPYPTLAGLENGDQSSSTRLPMLADVLGVNPQWLATGRGPRNSASIQVSHAVRLDPAILARTHELLKAAFALQGADFEVEGNWDLFADAYEYMAEDDRPADQRNLVDFGKWFAARKEQDSKQGDAGDEGKQAAGKAGGTRRRRAS